MIQVQDSSGGGTRQFNNIPSNTCVNGPESRVSDPWVNAHWGNILLLNLFLFSLGKTPDANIAIIAIFVFF